MARELIIEELRFVPVTVIEEGTGTGVLRFEAVVSEADFLNRNRRVYPEGVLFPAFESYKAKLTEGTGQPGLVDHPGMLDGPSLSDIGIKWEDFIFEGKKVIGRGSVVLTHRGQDLAAVMKAGIPVGFSTRGYGEAEEFEAHDGRKARRMKPGYELETVDAVVDPSVLHARVRRVSQEETDKMEQELNELKARLAELEAQLAEAVTARDEAVAGREAAEARVAELEPLSAELESARARIAELEAAAAEVAHQAAENALTARLNELTEGHRFAPTIIAEARELGVTIENVEKVIERLTALVEAAAAATNEAAPRGDVSTDEDVEQEPETPAAPRYTAEQLADQREANLISEAQYKAALALLS